MTEDDNVSITWRVTRERRWMRVFFLASCLAAAVLLLFVVDAFHPVDDLSLLLGAAMLLLLRDAPERLIERGETMRSGTGPPDVGDAEGFHLSRDGSGRIPGDTES